MYQKIQLLFVLMVGFSVTIFAQQEKGSAIVKGKLFNQTTGQPANDVQITIPYLKLLTTSDGVGEFSFSPVPYGTHNLVISSPGTKPDTIRISVAKAVVDIGNINVVQLDAAIPSAQGPLPMIELENNNSMSDDESGVSSQNVSGILTASRDPFLNAASYTFGTYRFQTRGYDRSQQEVLINGAPMNDIETGDVYWSQWGGLNDIFRSRITTYGLQPSEYTFGGINGSVFMDISAASQRKQTKVTYSLSNRTYRNRLMLTHSSGLNKNGWAYSLSLSKRWAKEGYIEGTFYDGYSYYAGVSKKIGSKHLINLSTFGAPTKRGKMAGSYQEAYDLAGSNFYNPNWGYQNGEKRNAKVADIFQPVVLLNYEYTPSNDFHWNTTVGYQFGKNANSTLDWYNAEDPRPDYYRYLPSYYLNSIPPNPDAAEINGREFQQNPQIDWDALYQANYLNNRPIPNADGSLSMDSGRRSVYVVGSDVDDVKKWTFSTNIQKVLSNHITIYTGLNFISQRTESYKRLDDLLGGDYFLNVNSFTERNFSGTNTFNQNDINNPNQLIKEGDKYYYDYNMRFTKAWWWAQAMFTFNKIDFFIAGNYGFNSFEREGLYRNGLYTEGNESYGKGAKQNFSIYGLKGGVTYKINGRNYLFVNASMAADAPSVDNTYFAARTRNAVVGNAKSQKTNSIEAGYLHRSPKANARVVGYVTDMKDIADVQRFYYTGSGTSNAMVDYVLQDVNTRNIGTELALEYKLTAALSATAVAAVGQSFFTSNPNVTRHYENTVDVPEKEISYLNNYYLGVGPQSAYTLGFTYRSKQYWMGNLNFNYFDRNYIDVAASRRTTQAVELVEPGSEQWNAIIDQEKMDPAFTVDLSFYKSWLLSKAIKGLPRNTFLALNFGIGNLLDNKNFRTGGYENLRYDYAGGASGKFASKYFYSFGRNFFINLSLRF